MIRALSRVRPERLILVWLLLMAATVISWRVGEDHRLDGRVAATIVLLVAYCKLRLVGLHFMELRAAPSGLRLAFEAYCLTVGGALVVMYVVG